MEYLLVMSLSGSVMTVMYLLTRRFLKERLCAGMYYLLAKAAVLYYLIPLPFLQSFYREFIPKTIWENHREPARIPLTWTSHAVFVDGDMHFNVYILIQTAIALVWVTGSAFLIVRQMITYVRITRRFSGYAQKQMTEEEKAFVGVLKEEYGIRRRVSFVQVPEGESAFTFGIFKPIIICSRKPDSREAELLVRHEMVHIRRMDVLWKVFLEFMMFLHWWNPFMWMLRRSFNQICECACDEAVMRGRTEEEIKEYLLLLIREAEEKRKEGLPLRWKTGFTRNAENIRERMNNLMNKNKWNKYAAGVLATVLIFANSMTVFAYRDPFAETLPENATQEEIAFTLENDVSVFAPEGEGDFAEYEMEEEVKFLYESQFTDEAGNVYPVLEDEGIEPHCNHVYISGKLENHHPYSDGGCEVRIYKAQRCSKCGHVIRGDWISTYTYAVCPH